MPTRSFLNAMQLELDGPHLTAKSTTTWNRNNPATSSILRTGLSKERGNRCREDPQGKAHILREVSSVFPPPPFGPQTLVLWEQAAERHFSSESLGVHRTDEIHSEESLPWVMYGNGSLL
jgi:hypothetical protein